MFLRVLACLACVLEALLRPLTTFFNCLLPLPEIIFSHPYFLFIHAVVPMYAPTTPAPLI